LNGEYDTPMAERINGPYKTAVIKRRDPLKTKEKITFAPSTARRGQQEEQHDGNRRRQATR
jgi:hypothetical protein